MRSRRTGALGVAGAVVLGLAGCAGAEGVEASEPDGSREPRAAALGGTLTVFAAASLRESFDAMSAAFTAEHPDVEVVLNLAGSSGLAAQIVGGAPADVFAAASPATMAVVVEAGLAQGESAPFARNEMVIAVPAGNPGAVTGLADLADPERTIALCSPEVPCGAAAQGVFALAGLVPAPDTLEQDVKAAVGKVALGEVDAALVYRTDVLAAGDAVEGIPFGGSNAAVNAYRIAVVQGSDDADAAAAFVAFVLSPSGQQVLADAGFATA